MEKQLPHRTNSNSRKSITCTPSQSIVESQRTPRRVKGFGARIETALWGMIVTIWWFPRAARACLEYLTALTWKVNCNSMRTIRRVRWEIREISQTLLKLEFQSRRLRSNLALIYNVVCQIRQIVSPKTSVITCKLVKLVEETAVLESKFISNLAFGASLTKFLRLCRTRK